MSARVRVKFREVGEVGEVIGALGAAAELWSYPLRAVVENELLRGVDSSLLLREAEQKKSRVDNDDRIQVWSKKRVDSRARIWDFLRHWISPDSARTWRLKAMEMALMIISPGGPAIEGRSKG